MELKNEYFAKVCKFYMLALLKYPRFDIEQYWKSEK